MSTLRDIVEQCPLLYWTKEHRYSISIELATGQTLVMRTRLTDLRNHGLKPFTLRANTPWLADKPHSVLSAICDLVDARFLQLATDQLAVAQYVGDIMRSMGQKQYKFVYTVIIPLLATILLKYEPTATLAGWTNWLEMCVKYCKTSHNEGKL